MYLLALVCPPLAVLLTGRIFQAMLSVPFTCCFILPGMLHAILVVSDHKANKRADRVDRKASRRDVVVTTNVQVVNVIPSPVTPISPLVAEAMRDQQVQELERRKRAAGERLAAEKIRQLATIDRRDAILAAIVESPRRTLWAGIDAYHELPEWAQPVTWGLAAGTPFAIIGAVLFLTR